MREWTHGVLADVADIRASNVDKLSIKGERPIQLCNYMDVYANERITAALSFMAATATDAEIARFRVETGDVILTKDSETPDDIGISAVVSEPIPDLVCGYHLALLKPRKDTIDPAFLAKQLGSRDSSAYFARAANGSTRYGLSYAAVARTPVRWPELSRQQRIAEILSTLDEAIEQTEALIAKTQAIKAGLMHDLFTRGVTANGELRPPREEAPQLYKESPLGWIPKEWAIRSLQGLARIDRGKFSIRPRNDPRYYDGEFPFIQTGDVALAAGGELSHFTQTLNQSGLAVSRMFPAGTIMVTIAANIGDTCILSIPMCAPDSLVGVVPNEGEVGRFLQMCIQSRKRWFENRAPQTAQRNINLEDLRPLRVPYPDGNEQLRITSCFDTTSLTLGEEEAHIVKLLQCKHGLMHDLLTGRARVPLPELEILADA
jgi:type I restriction enzyme S subunit